VVQISYDNLLLSGLPEGGIARGSIRVDIPTGLAFNKAD